MRLNGTVPAEPSPTSVGDHDNDGIPDRMAKFSRAAVIALMAPPEATLSVGGQLADGTRFEGSDAVRVISGK
ncbi:MAG: hypothetical protein QXT68_07220 [Halobacteria archaeon]